MKIIDLLNKIANGEEVPKKIKFGNNIYEYEEGIDYKIGNGLDKEFLIDKICISKEDLNDEVEILDEPKEINKIRINYNSINIDKAFETGTTTFFRAKDIEIFQCLSSKINEIIDKINKE